MNDDDDDAHTLERRIQMQPSLEFLPDELKPDFFMR